MGHNMYIKAKEEANLVDLNNKLEQLDSENRFLLEEDNQLWLDDINNNKKSPQRHLKPQDRDLSMEELKSRFKSWTEVGVLSTDLYFGRTSEKEMKLLAKFIYNNERDIEYITSADMLIERGHVDKKYHRLLIDKNYQEDEPEKLPMEEQIVPTIKGGILLCKSFSTKPFYVTFGKVDKPAFLKTKVYKNDLYNEIYKDPQGFSYLLLPLNDFSEGFGEKVYEYAWELGLREEPHFFLSYVYNYSFSSVEYVSERFKSFYSTKEREERLEDTVKILDPHLNLVASSKIKAKKGKLVLEGHEDNQVITTKLDLINALILSLKEEKGTLFGYDPDKRKLMFL